MNTHTSVDSFGHRMGGDREMDILQKFSIQALIYREIQLLKPHNRPQRSEEIQEQPPEVNMTKLRGELKKALTEYTGSQTKFADIMDVIKQINDGQQELPRNLLSEVSQE